MPAAQRRGKSGATAWAMKSAVWSVQVDQSGGAESLGKVWHRWKDDQRARGGRNKPWNPGLAGSVAGRRCGQTGCRLVPILVCRPALGMVRRAGPDARLPTRDSRADNRAADVAQAPQRPWSRAGSARPRTAVQEFLL